MLNDLDPITLLPSTDLERSRAFFVDKLGLTHLGTDPFALVVEVAGKPMRVTKVPSLTPHPFAILAWSAPDIEATVDWLAGRGIEFERYDGMVQDERGIWTVPGQGAKVAWFKDPDGNTLSVVQPS